MNRNLVEIEFKNTKSMEATLVANGRQALYREISFQYRLMPITKKMQDFFLMGYQMQEKLTCLSQTFPGENFGIFTDKFGIA